MSRPNKSPEGGTTRPPSLNQSSEEDTGTRRGDVRGVQEEAMALEEVYHGQILEAPALKERDLDHTKTTISPHYLTIRTKEVPHFNITEIIEVDGILVQKCEVKVIV